jgi:hypothetical protein
VEGISIAVFKCKTNTRICSKSIRIFLTQKNNKKETKPWNFYDAFHEAVKDKPEISLKHIRETGACKRDLHDKVLFSFLLRNSLAFSLISDLIE